MEIRLHRLPERPYFSTDVLVFHANDRNDIYHVANVTYSAKYGLFNCCDWYKGKDIEELNLADYNADIIAWAYMDEINVEVARNEVQ